MSEKRPGMLLSILQCSLGSAHNNKENFDPKCKQHRGWKTTISPSRNIFRDFSKVSGVTVCEGNLFIVF